MKSDIIRPSSALHSAVGKNNFTGNDSQKTLPKVLLNNFLQDNIDEERSDQQTSSQGQPDGKSDATEQIKVKTKSALGGLLRSNLNLKNANRAATNDGKSSNPAIEQKSKTRSKSEKDALNDSLSSSSSDDEMSEQGSSSVNQWATFEKHLLLIDDSSDVFLKQPRKTFRSSDSFQKVMTDLYGNSEYGVSTGFTKFRGKVNNLTSLASKLGRKLRNVRENARRGQELDLSNYEPEREPDPQTVENARRAWTVVRRYIQGMRMERKNNTSAFNWSIIQHHLKQRSNMDRAKVDLYERYGVIPKVTPGGQLVRENSMLSERARDQMARAEERRQMIEREMLMSPQVVTPRKAFSAKPRRGTISRQSNRSTRNISESQSRPKTTAGGRKISRHPSSQGDSSCPSLR